MPAQPVPNVKFEIGHVLFIDIVGYSKLSTNEQRAVVDELTQVVRASQQFQKAEATDRLIKIPTGDGIGIGLLHQSRSPSAMRN